jgi:hypothetical protein
LGARFNGNTGHVGNTALSISKLYIYAEVVKSQQWKAHKKLFSFSNTNFVVTTKEEGYGMSVTRNKCIKEKEKRPEISGQSPKKAETLLEQF